MQYKLVMSEHRGCSGYNTFLYNNETKRLSYIPRGLYKGNHKYLDSNPASFKKLPMFMMSGSNFEIYKNDIIRIGIDFYDKMTTLYFNILSPYIFFEQNDLSFILAYQGMDKTIGRSECPYELANAIVEQEVCGAIVIKKIMNNLLFFVELPEIYYKKINILYDSYNGNDISFGTAPNRLYVSGVDALNIVYERCIGV